jgi:hypothetical protein
MKLIFLFSFNIFMVKALNVNWLAYEVYIYNCRWTKNCTPMGVIFWIEIPKEEILLEGSLTKLKFILQTQLAIFGKYDLVRWSEFISHLDS